MRSDKQGAIRKASKRGHQEKEKKSGMWISLPLKVASPGASPSIRPPNRALHCRRPEDLSVSEEDHLVWKVLPNTSGTVTTLTLAKEETNTCTYGGN